MRFLIYDKVCEDYFVTLRIIKATNPSGYCRATGGYPIECFHTELIKELL